MPPIAQPYIRYNDLAFESWCLRGKKNSHKDAKRKSILRTGNIRDLKNTLTILALLCCMSSFSQQESKRWLKGMYLQWGYNTEWYTQSNLHFSNPGKYDFTLYQVTAKDKPDLDAVVKEPVQITIPQCNYRIGFYLDDKRRSAIEINFDHAKYVMIANQTLRMKGTLDGRYIDKDTLVQPYSFLSFEHTNGANFFHINYVYQQGLLPHAGRDWLHFVGKAGAGIVVPRTDVYLFGHHLDNKYHVAGYILSVEAGLRYYMLRKLFLETTIKSGFADYLNVLTVEGGRSNHCFGYFEMIAGVGYDINFGKKKH